ncbi:neural cell adhesion molecule 2-like [Pomacea canaliculata]|uniref:neural cell adhesion molecule 2-like n=1 Tax=Pomacea canaliculata TaxID=400727 RepID=UPI000D73836F|nr:neural cell adhesion molecule 2-like [Pomacea canaliculata]
MATEHLIIASAPKNLTVIEGSPFRLECRFSSDPPPSITWYYVSNNGIRQVVTSGVTGDKRSFYPRQGQGAVCNIVISDISVVVGQSSADVIKSDVTGKMTSAELTHAEGRGKGPKPYITETSGNITVLEGQNVTLMCRSNSLPQPQIHWAYNRIDSHVYEDSREELQIEDIRKVDGGDYTCTASNKFGHTSVTLHVNVQGD